MNTASEIRRFITLVESANPNIDMELVEHNISIEIQQVFMRQQVQTKAITLVYSWCHIYRSRLH